MNFSSLVRLLCESDIEDANFEAGILWDEFCQNTSREEQASPQAEEKLRRAISLRADHTPLQYIIGKWWFWDCEFLVSPDCLCPRPDTEILVEQALKHLPKNAHFADLCTGSGCIAISILHTRHDTTATAVELYPKTLELANNNAEKNGVSDRFLGKQHDIFLGAQEGESFDIIVSNPPYIRPEVIDTLSLEVMHEPRAALDGGADGLDFYRGILDGYKDALKDNGRFLFEIGFDQAEDIKSLAAERNMECEIIRDYGNRDRVAIVTPNR